MGDDETVASSKSSEVRDKELDSDRRLSESWLHQALELSLFERFCRPKKTDGAERALILHALRHGSRPDYALLDASQRLILIELKRGRQTPAAAKKTAAQLAGYAREYAQLPLGELAVWYCQHGIDVNSWFEYRGEYCLRPGGDDGSEYGRLIRWGGKNFPHYRKGAVAPDVALETLLKDYEAIVGKPLPPLKGDDHLEVGRCIMIAEGWPKEPEPFEFAPGKAIERWKYPSPVEWAKPWVAPSGS